jgi:hypothetical protein
LTPNIGSRDDTDLEAQNSPTSCMVACPLCVQLVHLALERPAPTVSNNLNHFKLEGKRNLFIYRGQTVVSSSSSSSGVDPGPLTSWGVSSSCKHFHEAFFYFSLFVQGGVIWNCTKHTSSQHGGFGFTAQMWLQVLMVSSKIVPAGQSFFTKWNTLAPFVPGSIEHSKNLVQSFSSPTSPGSEHLGCFLTFLKTFLWRYWKRRPMIKLMSI